MIFNQTYTDIPVPTYVSTLVEAQAPVAAGSGSLFLPDWNKVQASAYLPLTGYLAISKPLTSLQEDLLALSEDEDEDAPPQRSAIANAILLSAVSVSLLANRWKKPRVSTDGYGGVRLSWKGHSREVRVAMSGENSAQSYLYWEGDGQYGSVRGFTGYTLFSYLEALLAGKSFPK